MKNKLEAIQDLWKPHTLSLLAGQPRMGKTTFILSMAKYIAVDRNIPVLLLTLHSTYYCCKRLVVNTYNLETQVVYQNEQGEIELLDYTQYDDWYEPGFSTEKFKDEEAAARILENVQILQKAPLYISYEIYDELNSMAWIKETRDCVIKNKIQYVFIDFNYWRGYKHPFLLSLRYLVNELDCAIIATAFISRLGYTISYTPKLLEISSKEMSATDIIMFLDRPRYKNVAKIIAMKPNGNLIGDFDLLYVGKYAKFVDVDNNMSQS